MEVFKLIKYHQHEENFWRIFSLQQFVQVFVSKLIWLTKMLLGNWWKTFAAVSWYLRTSSKFHSWLHTVHKCTCAARWLWAKVISNFLFSIFTLAGALISLLRKHALKVITTRLSCLKRSGRWIDPEPFLWSLVSYPLVTYSVLILNPCLVWLIPR